jgi:PAS domain S-box-containing protein
VIGTEGLKGILAVYWEEPRVLDGAHEVELISALADQAAIALDNAERVSRLRASTAALRKSKERFRELVEATSDWLWEVDENGVYTYASPRVRQLLGYEPEEVLGRTPFDLMPPEEARRVAEVFSAIAAERRPFASLENTNRHRDGHLVALETSGIPLFDAAGRFCGYRGIDRDITERNRVEQALRASEAKLAGIISTAADAIISVDEAQRIVMYNEAAQTIFGWSSDEVLGKPLDILLPERVREIHRQHVQSFSAGPETARKMGDRGRAFFGLRKSGEEFPADASISKLSLGGAWLFTVALRDITEQKRIEHEEQFLAEVGDILATTLDAQKTLTNVALLAMREFADFCVVEFVDEQGKLLLLEVVTSDPAKAGIAEALKRCSLDRNCPHLSSTILEPKKPQMVAEVSPETIRVVAQSEEHRRLWEAIAPTSMMGVPLIVHDRVLGALVVASCRPERRYGAADLRLLEKVGRRAVLALESARLHRATERAVQARDDVLRIVAHDLRNPLTTILAAARLALPRGDAERGRRRPAEMIERAAKRMDRLIQDLLDVTRMEAGRLSIESARVLAGQVIFDSAEAQQALVSAGSLELRLEVAPELPDIWADRDRLLQVFENLIGNASKFTAPGGRITVGARPGEGDVVFFVADTGIGITAGDLPRLFDPFWQARKGERRSAGLGLPIVKGIVEAHGGRIWVESTPGHGSTFHFTVPVASSVEARLRIG